MIKLLSLKLQLGTKVLLKSANITVHPGQKCGVIGPNGTGKTSLFKLLLREVVEEAGELQIPAQWQLAHMAQELYSSELNALDFVLTGDEELQKTEDAIALLGAENSADAGEKLATLYEKLEAIDGYTARSRAQKLLHGLGFQVADESKPLKDFSGGWRIRLNLAKALMCRSDLLLLDEPTNHLDLDATLWLESWLQGYRGTLLIISHDRDFLDNVISNVISFESAELYTYKGNYSAYELQKAERLAQQAAAFQKQQERIAEIENFVRRFRAKASKAKQAQSRLKELERMEKISSAHIDSPFSFSFPAPEKTSQNLVTLSAVNIGYDGKHVLSHIELSILDGARIGLLGHNGEGKSTLIKTLANALPLIGGERTEGAWLRMGYFAQHQLEALDLQASALLHLQRIYPKASEQSIRTFLGTFDFVGDRVFENIRHFSGGEKARLALAIIAWQKPNLLLLDEPTNHLDLEVRHALTLALQAYSGAIVIVSHDRHLLRNTVDEFLLVDAGKISPFKGDLQDYHQWLLTTNTPESTKKKNPDSVKTPVDKKSQRQKTAADREKRKPLMNAIKKVDREILRINQALQSLEAELADEARYHNKDPGELATLGQRQHRLQEELEACEGQWLELTQALDDLENA